MEALESHYPIRVRRYCLRYGSGGAGGHPGGDGLVREVEFLAPAEVSILSDRRLRAPWGLEGGEAGATGVNHLAREGGQAHQLPGKCQITVNTGDVVRIETPGGGGWGRPAKPGGS